jgi:hypothetical protein
MADLGSLMFSYENSAIMPTCVYIEEPVETLQSVRVIDNSGTDATFTDDFTIVVGNGIKATVSPDKVYVTFEIDPAYVETQLNSILSENVGNSIKTINGISPDDTGDFQIKGLDCTAIGQQASGITIDNPCAKPCCDSNGADSAEILKALTDLTAAKDVLNNYYVSLATNVNSLQARLSSLIASRR